MLDEIEQITCLAEQAGAALQCRTVCVVDSGGVRYPVQVLSLGSRAPEHGGATGRHQTVMRWPQHRPMHMVDKPRRPALPCPRHRVRRG